MKDKKRGKSRKRKQAPFLVLPLIDVDQNENEKMPTKNPGLRLFTKTWVPKIKEGKSSENLRPLTATLEKPQVLDISFITKIDMSLMRKEFLSITNLCRVPLTAAVNVSKARRKPLVFNQRRSNTNRPLSLPSNAQLKKPSRPATSEDSWEDEESSASQSARKIKMTGRIKAPSAIPKQRKTNAKQENDANNNYKTYKAAQNRTKLPEPCKTCGRPNQPERFHSHPVTPSKEANKKMEEAAKIPVKNTVQKPVAIKYQSKKAAPAKETSPVVKISAEETTPRIPSGKGPRTLTCYICGREFGTKSLPLHEPKCMEKWKRENESLPQHLRRKSPVKPDHPLTRDEWNTFAWESSQSSLVPCGNCGRTFYPDRLVVHQRSCKRPHSQINLHPPSMVAFKEGKRNRKKRICTIMVLVMVIIGPLHGEMNVTYLFVRYKFKWDEMDYSLYSTFNFVVHMMGTLFSLMFFSKFLKLDDALLGMISSMSKICACVVYAFAPTPAIFYLGAVLEIFNGTSFIAMRSIMSKLVPPEELGKINSLFGVSEALMPLIYGPMYSMVYKATINYLPGCFYLLGGALTTPAIVIFFWLYTEHKRDLKEEQLEKAQQEELLKHNDSNEAR